MGKLIDVIVLILALYTVWASANDEVDKNIMLNIASCKTKTKATEDDVKMAMEMKNPGTSSGKCYVGCLYEKFGLLENGKFLKKSCEQQIYNLFSGYIDQQINAKKFTAVIEKELAKVPQNSCSMGPVLHQHFKNIADGIMQGRYKKVM